MKIIIRKADLVSLRKLIEKGMSCYSPINREEAKMITKGAKLLRKISGFEREEEKEIRNGNRDRKARGEGSSFLN